MKRIYPILMVCFVLASCHHDDVELGYDFSQFDTDGRRFIPYSERDCDVQEEHPWTQLEDDVEFDSLGNVIEDNSRKASSLVTTDLACGIVESLASYKVHQVCGTYESVDAYGNQITLSGAVFYPPKGTIRNIIICSHYTVAANYEVPSQTFPIEASLAALGYLVVMPDYIGYGVSKDCVHPYLQAETTARNVLDMALGVYSFVRERKLPIQNPEVILVGYSQGGATSMWVQYFMETDEYYHSRFSINGRFMLKKNYCGGGPYNVARTYDYCVKLDETGIPYAVPMIILGMSEGMVEPLDMAAFFQEPLLSNYKEWFNTKNYNGIQITKMIGVNRLSKILTPLGLDRSQGETQRLYRALQENSLPMTYRPTAPVYMFHSMDDQTVPFINAQVTRYNFSRVLPYNSAVAPATNVEYDFGHYGNHQSGCIKFYLHMLKTLK